MNQLINWITFVPRVVISSLVAVLILFVAILVWATPRRLPEGGGK